MNTPSDHFFRGFLSDIRIAKEFCSQFLPNQVKNLFDIDTINIANTSFIEPGLGEIISDVIFSFKKGDHTNYVYVVVEHQSQPDRFLPIRMARYIYTSRTPRCEFWLPRSGLF